MLPQISTKNSPFFEILSPFRTLDFVRFLRKMTRSIKNAKTIIKNIAFCNALKIRQI